MRSLAIGIIACLCSTLVLATCPDITSLTLANGNPTLPEYARPIQNLEYVSEGDEYCVYKSGNVVAKLSRTDQDERKSQNSIKAHTQALLKMTQVDGRTRLFNYGEDNEGRKWVIEAFENGKFFYQTTRWVDVVGGEFVPFTVQTIRSANNRQKINSCIELLEHALYERIKGVIVQYVGRFGMVYGDIHPRNFLFSDDWSQVTIIDWSDWQDLGPNWNQQLDQSYVESLRNIVDFKLRERFPAKDAVLFPGFCWSQVVHKVPRPYPNPSSTYQNLLIAYRDEKHFDPKYNSRLNY